MKTKISLTVTSTIILLLSACGLAIIPGSGRITSETREVQGYSQIVFSAPGELTIDQNGHEGLAIAADDNLLPYIHTRVQSDVLYIYVEPDLVELYPSKPILYTLSVGPLSRVTLSGSGSIRADELIASNLDFDLNGSGEILVAAVKSQATALDLDGSGKYRLNSLMTDQFTVSLDGSGDIAVEEVIVKSADIEIAGSGKFALADIVADTLDMTINGSGDSNLSGMLNQQSIAIYGSGSYDSRGLQSQVATVKITGSGDSEVWVTDELNVTITGSGDITYRGNPAVTQTITGSGYLTSVARQ
jgi:hypothetical protein